MAENMPSSPGSTTPVLVPPDERFWKRYSPHHEFPLSASTSAALHGLALALLIGLGYLMLKLGVSDASKPLPVDAITIAGGGGSPDGQGTGPGDAPKTEEVGGKTEPDKNPRPAAPRETLKEASVDPLELPMVKDAGGRLLDDASESAQSLSKLVEGTRKQIYQGMGKGEGGSGSGGGKGKGKGTGEGDAEGAGKGTINIRQKRVLRWTLIFNTVNGDDYRRQLSALGAILALPEGTPNAAGEYPHFRVLRDLTKRPAPGDIEDIAPIQLIRWVDNRPESVAALSLALGLRQSPPLFVAFFPKKLEDELLTKELNYRGKKEDDIKETRFRVERRGGTYVPVVEEQR